MRTEYRPGLPVGYSLPVGDEDVPLASRIGNPVRIEFLGQINCLNCGRVTRKSFGQGHCYPCFRDLARCDSCIVKPELCHYAKGTCREPEWGETHCLIPHTVHLSNSSALKVGITRGVDPVGRWIDQGACQGLAIRRVATRLESGEVETSLKRFVADKTNWRKMLQGEPERVDLRARRDELLDRAQAEEPGAGLPGNPIDDAQIFEIAYPVLEYPKKVVSHNLEKASVLEGTLTGIKGQYLILDTAVINIRKYGGYQLRVSWAD